jgi:hypothetical protein
MDPPRPRQRAYESLGQMRRLRGTQIAHLKFAVEKYFGGIVGGIVGGIFQPREARDVGFSTYGTPGSPQPLEAWSCDAIWRRIAPHRRARQAARCLPHTHWDHHAGGRAEESAGEREGITIPDYRAIPGASAPSRVNAFRPSGFHLIRSHGGFNDNIATNAARVFNSFSITTAIAGHVRRNLCGTRL